MKESPSKNVIYEHLESYIAKLEEIGVRMDISEDEIYVYPSKDLKASQCKNIPIPWFCYRLATTDHSPLLLKANGTSEILDTIYAKRVNHIPELARMGAQATTEGNLILLNGPSQLHGAEVVASDLRAGACLVIAGLMATGTTTVFNVEYILRGYDHIIDKLTALGADIQMVEGNYERLSNNGRTGEQNAKKKSTRLPKNFRIPYYSQMNKKNYHWLLFRAQAEKQGFFYMEGILDIVGQEGYGFLRPINYGPSAERYLYFFFSDSPLQFAKWRQSSGESETAKRVRTLLWF